MLKTLSRPSFWLEVLNPWRQVKADCRGDPFMFTSELLRQGGQRAGTYSGAICDSEALDHHQWICGDDAAACDFVCRLIITSLLRLVTNIMAGLQRLSICPYGKMYAINETDDQYLKTSHESCEQTLLAKAESRKTHDCRICGAEIKSTLALLTSDGNAQGSNQISANAEVAAAIKANGAKYHPDYQWHLETATNIKLIMICNCKPRQLVEGFQHRQQPQISRTVPEVAWRSNCRGRQSTHYPGQLANSSVLKCPAASGTLDTASR